MERVDLLGKPLTSSDEELLALYTSLKEMAGRGDLPPCVERNVKKALACMWQVVNDLNLEYEQLYDVGV
jgi:hypothetical protein